MEGVDGSKGAWVKLKQNGEPAIVFESEFKADHYNKREINRIIRLSEIPEEEWTDWCEAHANEAAP